MKNLISTFTLSIGLLVFTSGCTPNISPDVINSSNANDVTNTVQGTIVSMRAITVKGNDNNLGMLAGGAAGAVAGSAAGGGTRMNLLGGIGGALLGGWGGNKLQDKLSSQQGIEYIIKTTSDHLITIVQAAGSQSYSVGQCVYAVEGPHARIVSGCTNNS